MSDIVAKQMITSKQLSIMANKTHKQVLFIIRKYLSDFNFIPYTLPKKKGGTFTSYYCPDDFIDKYMNVKRDRKSSDLLYLLTDGYFYKIGVTQMNTLNQRIKALQTGNPHIIKALFTLESEKAYELETFFHKKYAQKSMVGEWFNLNKEDINEMIESAKKGSMNV